MCNRGERETVEHLMMECEAHESEWLEMIVVILDERGEGDGVMYERMGLSISVLMDSDNPFL